VLTMTEQAANHRNQAPAHRTGGQVRGTTGERRVVTALFCDVVGSTSIAERLDPEDWADIVNGAFEELTEPIARYEGTVVRLLGDAILAFFGAPVSHEDDPRRAVLAAVEMMDAIPEYRALVKKDY